MKKSIVTSLVQNTMESLASTSYKISDQPLSEKETVNITNVTEFWEKAVNPGYARGTRIAIEGQLSVFGPALPGVPMRKREMLLETRRNLRAIEEALLENGYPIEPTTLDAIMGFTAGQMVIRPLHDTDTPYIYLGLYQSIVRNSIPLFVKRDYYEKELASLFASNTTIEALVIGYPIRVREMGVRFEALLKEFGIYKIFDPNLIKNFNEYILQVDGDDDLSRIEYRSPSRYLDGDIWVAIRADGIDRVVSRFLDISDPKDLINERNRLIADVKSLHKGCKIISEYDQVDHLMQGTQIISSAQIIRGLQKKQRNTIKLRENDKLKQKNDKAVFISYNHGDSDIATKLKSALEQNGIKVHIDFEAMAAGESISEFIQRSVRDTNTTISIVSSKSLLSAWVAMETTLSFYQEKLQNRNRFIACYIDDEFFQTDFRLKATKQIDERIFEIDSQIPKYIDLKLDTNDLNDEKSRLHKLRSNLGEYLHRMRETLTLDIGNESFDKNIIKIINTIKENK